MHNTTVATDEAMRSPAGASSGILRAALGLLQGISLYALHQSWVLKSWPATQSPLFIALLMLTALLPLAAISGIGHLGRRNLCLWLAALAIILSGLGFYDGWRLDLTPLSAQGLTGSDEPSATLSMLSIAGLFIAQALILAGNADGKRIAGYPGYFEHAWKLAVQILFAMLFCGLFWVVLRTGDALFSLIQLHFLRKLTEQNWFSIPVTTLAFAFGLHISDMRPHIIAGIRKLLLTLLSWLLPLATIMIGGFLLSILATGLHPLWQTGHASHVLLGGAALLVVLINTVYQDGLRTKQETSRFFRLCTRIACMMPAALVLLAMYSLGLRVMQYGWTVSRIAGTACTLVAAIYAIGYFIAALRLRDNLHRIAATNIIAAVVMLLVFLALLTPLANPARIAVASQLARLDSGKIAPADFDYHFLRFDGDRYGVAALQRLSRQQSGAQADLIREKAGQALAATNRWEGVRRTGPAPDLASSMRMHPADRPLPATFAAKDWRDNDDAWKMPPCMIRADRQCDAYWVAPTPSGNPQLLVFHDDGAPALFMPATNGEWKLIGKLQIAPACARQIQQAAGQGALHWQMPLQRDLEMNGVRLSFQPEQGDTQCPDASAAK